MHGQPGASGKVHQRIERELRQLALHEIVEPGTGMPSQTSAAAYDNAQDWMRVSSADSSADRDLMLAATAGVSASASNTLSNI